MTTKFQTTQEKTPIWKCRELWVSPFVVFLIIGYILFAIAYGLIWLVKWIIFSPIRPFTNSKWFCEQGFHRYRCVCDMNGGWDKLYKCNVCGKEKLVPQHD